MLQHLPSLQHLHVDEDGLETIVPTVDLHDLVKFSPTPFSLKCLSWFSYGLSLNAEKFARFIDDQPLLEQLFIPNLHIPSMRSGAQPIGIRRSSLEGLRVLHISIRMAPSFFFGRHITHLKIDSAADVSYSTWQALDTDALRSVVVCVLECIQLEYFTSSLAPCMPNLERLQLAPLYVPTVTMLCRSAEMGTTKLRHLRFTDPWRRDGRARNTLSEGVAIAFAAIPSLCCISLDTGYVTDSTSNFFPTYDFFFGTTTPVRLRARDFPPPQWWQDWEEGFDPVSGSEELASTSALSRMSPGQFIMFNSPS
ncbi:hypothetical protein CCMSSC00406_0007430 [Pleurotus cornucopiae]|uniref:Uncharacterized protein n=1 Tax=Pleurotus cornucopiae TaxID=5321 RepID=A0ACB7J5T1_PLECO|nr:hypothetical protein CCMSSC00406_0007430 [Pleurotus cornucopiae]